MIRRRFLALVGASALGGCAAPHVAAAGRFDQVTSSPPTDRAIEAFTSSPSLERGDQLALHVSSDHRDLAGEIRRIGWPKPTLVDRFRLRGAVKLADDGVWPVAIERSTATFPTGYYLVELRPVGAGGPVHYVPFVVRDRSSRASVVVQIPFFTYQAYNAWGGAGLYNFNSNDTPALSVRLDRPYDVFDGAGFCFYGDYQLATWLDRERVPVSYIASQDLHRSDDVLRGRRLFVSAFHDEYWSQAMRDRLAGFVAGGGNAAFFGANSIYWKVVINDQLLVCAKAGDTGRFRDLGQPESDLLGSWYDSYWFPYGRGAPWRARHTGHWFYADTGMADDDLIDGLVGYEWDQVPADGGPPGTIVL